MKTTAVKIKICGIRRLESALTATEEGADYLGFNFVPSSRRYISPLAALPIIQKIRGKVKLVGVFQNGTIPDINKTVDLLQLDYVQLHGNESPEFAQRIKAKVIKAFTLRSLNLFGINNYKIAYALLDRDIQGMGGRVPVSKAKEISSEFPTFLAGGLNAQNVTSIIRSMQPFGVDVAGGIETNNREDGAKIKEFIQTVKGVQI